MTDMLAPGTQVAVDPTALRPGLLVAPGDAGYDEARAAWNLTVDQRPAAVALPTDAGEVAEVVRHARDRGLRVTAQATGHNAGPLGDLSGTVLVRTHRMRGVTIDAEHRVARVEAGAQWVDVVGPAAEHGLIALHGSAPDVGVVGYTLGGGLSWYARRHGLASGRMLAAEVVTGEGELVRADRRANADLFWALRGGGGSFGIVTALEFELLPAPQLQAGGLWFPVDRAADVLHAWRAWAPSLPDTVSTSARILNVPPMPEIPEPIRGRSFALVLVTVMGDEAEAARVLEPLRALGPEMDTVVPTAPQDMLRLAMDPPNPVPALSAHVLFDELTAEAVDAIVEHATAAKALVVAHLTLGGGAVARGTAEGAVTAIEAPVMFFAAGIAPPPMAAATAAEMAGIEAALAPYASARAISNFAERPTAPERLYGAAAAERLRAVKAAVDPDGVIAGNHEVRV